MGKETDKGVKFEMTIEKGKLLSSNWRLYKSFWNESYFYFLPRDRCLCGTHSIPGFVLFLSVSTKTKVMQFVTIMVSCSVLRILRKRISRLHTINFRALMEATENQAQVVTISEAFLKNWLRLFNNRSPSIVEILGTELSWFSSISKYFYCHKTV